VVRQSADIARSKKACGLIAVRDAAFATYPGAAILVGPSGQGAGLNSRGETLLVEAGAVHWAQVVRQIAAVVERGLATIEALALERVLEATVLPLADGAALVLVRDQGLETNLREALIESRQRFKALVEISSDFAWETNADSVFTFVSPHGALGWTAADLLGRHATEFLIDATRSQAQVFRTEAAVADMDLWFKRADGGAACLGVAAVPVLTPEGAHKGARGVCRDLTADRARDEALARARLRDRLMAHMVRTMRDEIEPQKALSAAVSAAGLAAGAAGGLVLRRLPDGTAMAAVGWGEPVPPEALSAVEDQLVGAIDLELALGEHLYAGMATRYRGASNGALVLWRRAADGAFSDSDRAVIADVADQLGIAIAQVVHHERIVQLSRTDELTGLLNRRACFEELERRLGTPDAQRRPGALVYLDLDNFKVLNDYAGHGAGDEALRSFAHILRQNTRGNDVTARLGGDEFVVWIDGIDPAVAETRARAILEAFRTLAPGTGDATRPLSVSMGLALYAPQSGETLEALVARADRAMYAAKQAGRGQLRYATAPAPREGALAS
jgi:diguanylate cyclase (GGDEF)-like protein/PAS domain S-box-containing protein